MTDGIPASPTPPPAAWYADPSQPTQWRYWDGTQWTEHIAPSPGLPQATKTYDLPDGQRYVRPIRAFVLGFKQYISIDGRSSRSEFFWFWLFSYVIALALAIPAVIAFVSWISRCADSTLTASCSPESFTALNAWAVPSNLWLLAILLPGITVSVRRLHDIGYSGWYYLFFLIPFAGFVLMIVWGVRQGSDVPNQYGPPPSKGLPNAQPGSELSDAR